MPPKCVISPLFKINQHHQVWNRANTPNRYAPPARIWTRGFQHLNWVCRPLHHQSLTLSSYLKTTDVSFMPRVAVWISLHTWLIHGFGLCIFPSHPKKQDKILPLLKINIKIIHSFWVLRAFVIRENRKNLRIDWEKMYAIHLKLEWN